MTLAKDWLVWFFKMVIKVNKILHDGWKWGSQNIFLKKWHVDFDAITTHVDILLVRVQIMGLPLVLWLEDFFKVIGNALGSYF